jgi:thiamine-phosphate pyrophosphorylase
MPRLYVITDRKACAPRPLAEVVREILEAGVRAVQLREKDMPDSAYLALAASVADLCRSFGACLFVNSRVRIARAVGAAGVHLPSTAPPVREALGGPAERLAVGCSAHSLEEAKRRESEGADFLTFSPVYLSAGKSGYGPPAGMERLSEVSRSVRIPVLALGGVTPERVPECLQAGAYGAAVLSGLMVPTGAGGRAVRYLRELDGALP